MPEGYKIYDQGGCYYLTLSIVGWVDIFTRKIYRDILIDSFNFSIEKKQLQMFGWVIMTNHIHCIVAAEKENLSDIIGELKSFTSKEIIKAIKSEGESRREWMLRIFSEAAQTHERNTNYQVWTHNNHPSAQT